MVQAGSREVEAERALLGCILLRHTLICDIERVIPDESYLAEETNQRLYNLMRRLRDAGQTINITTTSGFMGTDHARTSGRIINRCLLAAGDPDVWPEYAAMVEHAYRSRQLCTNSSRLFNMARDGDLASTHDLIETLSQIRYQPNGRVFSYADVANLEAPEWIWEGWIRTGVCHMIFGAKGDGKTFTALRLIKTFTTGCPWPDGTPFEGEPGYVVYADAENFQLEVCQHMLAMGIPLDRVLVPSGPTTAFQASVPEHCAALRYLAGREDVRAVFVDGLQAAQPSLKENSSDFAKLPALLSSIAKDSRKPTFILHHPKKVSLDERRENEGLLQREHVRGHGSIIAQTRIVWGCSKPDKHSVVRVLHVVISNLENPGPMAYVLSGRGPVYDGHELPVASLQTTVDEACDVARDLLRGGAMLYSQLREAALARGVATSALGAARRRLRLVDFDPPDGGRDRLWGLPVPGEELTS